MYIYFFHCVNSCPKRWDVSPHTRVHPRASTQTSPLPLPLAIGWLLRVATEWRPTKSNAPWFSIFSMRLFWAPQTGKPAVAPPNPSTGALCGTIGIRGAIGWGHRCSTHGDRGAEPLEGRAPADLFGVLVVVFLAYVNFCSYHKNTLRV